MQRLFSAFPNNWPGGGLLLLRVVTAIYLVCALFEHPAKLTLLPWFIPRLLGAAAGILLLFGLGTPICGAFIGAVEAWIAFSNPDGYAIPILLGASASALAMTGPGAWSIDARLFGRKHVEISQR